MFSDEDARRLDALKRRRAQGDLGLTEGQRGMAEAAAQVQRGAVLRDLQAMPVARRPPATVKPSWAPWARRTRLMEARQASARDISQMDMQAGQAQREEISALAGNQAQSEAARKAAFFSALGGAAEVGGQAVTAQALRKDELATEGQRAERAAVRSGAGHRQRSFVRRWVSRRPRHLAPSAPTQGFLSNPSPTFR
jgi:hypothetical protein